MKKQKGKRAFPLSLSLSISLSAVPSHRPPQLEPRLCQPAAEARLGNDWQQHTKQTAIYLLSLSLSFSKPTISLSRSLAVPTSLANLTSLLSQSPPTSLALSRRRTTSLSKANFGRSLVPLHFLALLLLKCNAKLPLSKLTSLYLSLSPPPSLARSLHQFAFCIGIYFSTSLSPTKPESLHLPLCLPSPLSRSPPQTNKQMNRRASGKGEHPIGA